MMKLIKVMRASRLLEKYEREENNVQIVDLGIGGVVKKNCHNVH